MKPALVFLGLFLTIPWIQTSPQNQNGAHIPWFHDADNYWDFDATANDIVEDLKGDRHSRIIGNYNLFPGPKGKALELLEVNNLLKSYVILGEFSDTCLPDPERCQSGFTISFWVNLKKVLHDGVLLQLGSSRKGRGVTINTHHKEGKIFLIFYGNTRERIYTIKAELLSHIWHHVVLIWDAKAQPKMSLFVNCTSGDHFKATIKERKDKRGKGKKLILGANHAGKKAIPIAVDDFAIWFKSLKQERLCEIINQERVHGNYSSWSDFTSCSVTCGLGAKSRKRVCNNPIPDYGGRNCSKLGPSSQTVECDMGHCPIPGGYTPWSNFSECSVSCGGGGKRYRTRNCTQPKPRYGGQDCSNIGPTMETMECKLKPCPISGGYTPWSNFSECSVSCGGGGKQYRTRNCTQPKPRYGGQDCSNIGPAMETVECGKDPCPIPGGYTSWSNFSECSVSCGGGGKRYRTRNCTQPKPQYGGQDCSNIGPAMETVECGKDPCPISGGYTTWSNFSECSVSCGGGGKQYRTRNCTQPKPRYGGQDCSNIGPAMETMECKLKPCPIPGGYTAWSNFSECSVSCGGGGTRYRTRNCTQPIPQYGGQDCSKIGPTMETVECGKDPCPISGGYTSWSNFSECSVSCGGGGTRYRTRNCTQPIPQYGGQNCSNIGPALQTVECKLIPCPIPGGYTSWSNFSECSVSCGGGGTRYRTRNCTQPIPQYGGQDCSNIGPAMETVECGKDPCPIPGGYTAWSNFSECSVSCGGGGTRYRTRNCTQPIPQYGGQDCSKIGPTMETVECGKDPCPIPGGYTAWSNFSECSVSCGGGGTRYRTRNCTQPKPQYGGQDCSNIGPAMETVECGKDPCPIPGGYTAWSNFSECSASCGGGGTWYRTRNCTNPKPQYGGQNCSRIGPPLEVQVCNLTHCPVHGNYSAWSAFSSCSTSCGHGYKTRNRTCTEPVPKYGGRNCLGLGYEIRTCNLGECPKHGRYGEWSNFSVCSQTCGNSTKTRTRICDNPIPSYGGRDCKDLGPDSNTVPCDTRPCPIHGNYSDWSEFSPCFKTCGNSSKIRRRFCTNPAPRFGGDNCSVLGSDFEETPCDQAPCPVHGNFSEWSEFSKCSRTCGNSVKKRYRNCTRPIPMHGGNDCSSLGPLVQVVNCDVPQCPVNGNYSEWSKFSVCSHTCGNGTQFRTRHCNNPLPLFDGLYCSTLGPSNETRPCHTQPCPIHGNLSEWSEFSGCSETCGLGVKVRYRYCINPEPRFGGDSCSKLGPTSDVTSCDVRPCPIHGNYSTWSSFGPCSKSCDNGTQIRRRFCTRPSPLYGGRDCHMFGPNVEARHCETQPCPDIDFTIKFKLDHVVWTAELLVNSSKLYQDLSKELKTAIFELHKEKAIKDIKIMEYSPGSVVATMEVIYYSRDFPGAISLYDALYNDRRIGPYEITPLMFTSTDVPTHSVQNLTASNRSSTSLALHWSRLSSQPSQSAILGYAVIYEQLPWPGNVRSNELTRIVVFLNTTRGRLAQLQKYSWYRLRISGMNRRGVGIPSDPLIVLTDEDVPNASPNLKPVGYNMSSTSLNISWQTIPRADINGILRGYILFYKPSSSNEGARNITVPADYLSVHVTGLRKYTAYELRVAGVTSKGTGAMSARSLVYTDEDVPSASPVFHSFGNMSSTSIHLQWYKVLSNHQNGVILGYRIYYRVYLNSNESWNMIGVEGRETSRTVNNLTMFTKYLFQISAFTSKGEGNTSESILVSTDEDVPSVAPTILAAGAINSTSIWVKWSHLSTSSSNGILRGYIVKYGRKKYSENISVSPTRGEVILGNLWKFTIYHIQVAGFTSNGHGPFSETVDIRTDEDVPSTWPQSVHAYNTSSTSIKVAWNRIPQSQIHGNLRGYRIFLKRANESEWEGEYNVSETNRIIDIENLWKYTNYTLRVVGFTTAGAGVASPEVAVLTDEDVPSRAPEEFKAISKSTPTSIPLTWKPISDQFYIHGILLGYKIEFEMTHLAGNALHEHTKTVIHTTGPNILSHNLVDLEIYAVYRIRLRAFTVKGDGASIEISAETCRCASDYKTNWWINPPYIYKNDSRISGIFSKILPGMVSTCCGFCHAHPPTVTRFENHARDTSSYLKPGVSEFRDHVGDAIELHFPMYGQVFQVKYYKRYEFIPLVESPGVIFLVLEDDTHTASLMLLHAIGDTLPIVLLMVAFTSAIGIVMWCVESFSNNSQFPQSFFPGVTQGIWWAMVSMTTIGYGDKFPRSFAGRIICIFWILTGCIIVSLYTSIVTSNITIEVVAEPMKLYGMKVAVIQNSSEHQLAVRKNARADLEHSYNNLYDIYNGLTKGYVKGALVDAYVLGSRRDLFDNVGIRISKIYDYSSAYGVVLAGEAKKLQKCFREYISENRRDIFQIIEANVHTIEESEVSPSINRAKSLIDPTFIVYKQCLFISVVLFCLAFLLGVLFEYFKKPLKRTLCRTKFMTDQSNKRAQLLTTQRTLRYEMQETLLELTKKIERLKSKHRRELQQWIKLRKSLRRKRRSSEDSLIFSRTSVIRYDEPHPVSPLLQLRKLIANGDNSDRNNNSRPGSPREEETLV